jgi:ribonuclease HI
MDPESGSLFSDHKRDDGEKSKNDSHTVGEWVIAFCDGGSRGNPGPAGYGVLVEDLDGQKLAELSEYLGKATNNVAEYSALLAALEWALRHGRSRLRVVADSELMVKQIQGRYKVSSPDLRPLYEEAKRRIARLSSFRIEHVLRGRNQKADGLANAAMDRGTGRAGGTGRPGGTGSDPGGERPGAPKPRHEANAQSMKGYVKGGVVHFIEGELPDGTFVKITPDRQ